MTTVIHAEDVGIEFFTSRKRHMSIRELLFSRGATHTPGKFWAFRNVTFDVQQGEAVGIVGPNGTGKSTLLKIIAGVMLPDEGHVEVTQGVAPLIELTGGFKGELTARDNIFLTAGLHGLRREDVEERFDEIVDFAGPQVKRALDTPFRHFSSGMKVRLGFAVITTLDEPIILVDEVLAVGDRAFRNQCYARMEALLAEGRTLFLVSHSEKDLSRFCTRGLYLTGGRLVLDGPIKDTLECYAMDIERKA
ncbi:putative polysaccharide/polyol phosphate ABC transporter, ATP-binding protein [Nostocoides japonicum T1-X7]|uniref:Putative polysaccharide/polyol phosphate ABC transporter, ATP-binding protein n=1 Tax=Nostocoides japonicum T1-X7 TaxID=1194083 RepID=A0A077LZQ5_9MICO|nr:ABC transporter ATP-binding protein [Tetrasphaera japonica]CCH77455.1 putative polysaccharide/polyol phosphate ABC transporter, ATP-binding protein [Tetrasphaera japonica T1-X7]